MADRLHRQALEGCRTLSPSAGLEIPVSGTTEGGVWFGGVTQGRRAAIRTFGKGTARSASSGKPSASLALRIVMEVLVPSPMGVAIRSRSGQPAEAKFAFHFAGFGVDRVREGTQKAMLEFVRNAHPAGIDGLSVRLTPKPRDLKLADRASIPLEDIHPTVLADARVLLAHDHPEPHITPEELQKVFYEMAAVAYEVERSVVR